MIGVSAVDLIVQDGGAALAEAYFDGGGTFVMGQQQPYPSAVATRSYAAFDGGLAPILAGCGLASEVGAVVLDLEHWPLTPPEEQADPVGTYRAAYAAVGAFNGDCRDGGSALRLIATPATDLVAVLAPDAGPGQKYQAFLDLGLARDIAAACDILEVQAQGSEMSPAVFVSFVQEAAAQAQVGHPGLPVFAGLSTNPTGTRADAGTLFGDILQTLGTVQGCWLNVPGQSAACPTCGVPQPDVAIDLLQLLEDHG